MVVKFDRKSWSWLAAVVYPVVLPVLLAFGVSGLFLWEWSGALREQSSTPGKFVMALITVLGGPFCWYWSKLTLRLSTLSRGALAIHIQHCILIYISGAASVLGLVLDHRPLSQTEPGIYYVTMFAVCTLFASVINAAAVARFR